MGAILGGIIAAIGSAGAAVVSGVGGAAAALGIPEGIATGIGTGVEGALAGAGLGAAEGELTGEGPLKGAEFGALTGGAVGGLGAGIGSLTGLGTTAGDTIAGALGGELGGLATGQNGIAPALTGAAGGALTGLTTGGGAPATSAGGSGGGGVSAAATAAPASVGLSPPDLVSGTTDPLAGYTNSLGTVGSDPSLVTAGSPSLTGSPDTGGVGSAVSANLPGSVNAGAAAPSGLSTPNLPTAGTPNSTIGGIVDQGVANGGTVPGVASLPATPSLTANSAIGGIVDQGVINGAPAATAGGASPTTGAGASTGGGGFLSGLTKNPTELLGVGALGLDLLKGMQPPAYEGNIAALAKENAATGARLENYESTGTLPPGMQAGLTTAANDAAASIRSQYAQRGMSGSTAEAQDLANLSARTEAQSAQMAQTLFAQGLQDQQLSSQEYQLLMQTQLSQDTELSNSIGNLVGWMAKSSQPAQPSAGA